MITFLRLSDTQQDGVIPGQLYFPIEVVDSLTGLVIKTVKKTIHPHIPLEVFLEGLTTLANKQGATPLSAESITTITNTVNAAWTTEIVVAYDTYQTIPAPTTQQLQIQLKSLASSALAKTDIVVARIQEAISLGETTATAGDVMAFMNYRKALRAIVSGADITNTTLPPQPAYPAGT